MKRPSAATINRRLAKIGPLQKGAHSVEDRHEAAERAGVTVYGAEWLTMAKLMAAISGASVWSAPAAIEALDEPPPLPWLPQSALKGDE